MKLLSTYAIAVTILVCMFGQNCMAQNTTFKLSDYKNPNYDYRSLTFNFNLNNSIYFNTDGKPNDSKSNNFSLNSNAGTQYSQYFNSPKSQSEKHGSIGFGIGSTGTRIENTQGTLNSEDKVAKFNHFEDLRLNILHRFYNSKQKYIEVNGTLAASNQGNSENTLETSSALMNSDKEEKGKRYSTTLFGSVLLGTGRIEQVQDAKLAMYLLEDLHRLNREKRTASNEDIIELSELITTLKYKRFFDNRLRKIAEITAIDSFLQQKHITGMTDATYFTSVNDNWNFSNNPIRYSGHRIYMGMDFDFSYGYSNNYLHKIRPIDIVAETSRKEKNAIIFLVAGASYEKPVSLRWQNSASIKARLGMKKNTIIFDQISPIENNLAINSYTEVSPSINFSADYGIGYYPTSRTWLTLNWWVNAGYDRNSLGLTDKDKKYHDTGLYSYTGPSFNAYYYFSEKLRLTINFYGAFHFNYAKFANTLGQEDTKFQSNRWIQQVNAAITYDLF